MTDTVPAFQCRGIVNPRMVESGNRRAIHGDLAPQPEPLVLPSRDTTTPSLGSEAVGQWGSVVVRLRV